VALWFAEHYPKATVRGVSNSNSQREWIMARAAERGITNLKIYTGNIVSSTKAVLLQQLVAPPSWPTY
jgi:cyclopropane-fatty-acyl-phospholipid synthase